MADVYKDSVALVTGAASGIGRALSEALARRGARVVLTDLDEGRVREIAGKLGSGARGEALDVRDARRFAEIVDGIVREHGRIDYLFNNAGIGVGGEARYLTVDQWNRIIDINLRGVANGIATVYPGMVERGSGHIVNTASLAGLVPAPLLAPYAATKHAVVGLTTSLRVEGARYGVRFTALCPGAIETPLLDARNPADLPDREGMWEFNARRYLTGLTGRPVPAERFAEIALVEIARNRVLVIVPGRARLLHRIFQFAPGLLERLGGTAVDAERKQALAGGGS